MNTDEERFQYLYDQNVNVLRIIAKNRGIPCDEIDDTVQETFLSYYTHYPLTWPDRKVTAMLVKILKNLCIDYFRVKNHRLVDFLAPESFDEGLYTETKLKTRDTENIVLENMIFEDLLKGIRDMKEDWSHPFILYVLQGKTIDEVCQELNITEGACRMRITRGRKFLLKYMERHNGDVSNQNTEKPPVSEEPDAELSSL